MFISPMSALKRIRITDSSRASRRVRRVPICDIERERRGLVEGHADPLLLAPDNVTGNVRAVRLKDKVKTLGNVVGVGNIERRPPKWSCCGLSS
jgi:hypothetical protein